MRRPPLTVQALLAVVLTLVAGALAGPPPAGATAARSAIAPDVVPADTGGRTVAGQAAAVGSGVGVTPDPGSARYVGEGGIVVPSSHWRGDAGGRSDAAACTACRWMLTDLCSKADASSGSCRHIALGCPVGTTPMRVWLLVPGNDWRVVGTACTGGAPPTSRAALDSAVRDRAEQALPPLRAGVQPAGGVLVTVPAAFRTGQPGAGLRNADLSVLGFDVRLDARVRWNWRYGDGASTWTSSPGGRYPDLSVSHVYLSTGARAAAVTAVWRAQYVVDGLGPFPVPGPALTQTATVPLTVREARAHLVA